MRPSVTSRHDQRSLDQRFCCLSGARIFNHVVVLCVARNDGLDVSGSILSSCSSSSSPHSLHSVVAWLIASTAPMPYIASGHVYVFHPGKMFCFHNQVLSLSSSVIYVHVVVSLVILSFCYLQVFRGLRENSKRVKNLRGVPANSSSRITKEDIRLTRTLFVTVLGYFLCWTPLLVIDFVDMARGGWSHDRWVYIMYIDCGLLSSCINPFIYGAMNRIFRSEYKKLLRVRNRTEEDNKRETAATAREHPQV